MLRHLQIQNYAIMEDISMDLSSGLQVVTGETGAGKSIMAGALSLVLGERADTTALMDRDKKCIVEAAFAVDGKKDVEQFLADNGLDAERELILRREISANGKSRAFVNDTPVNLDQLRKLGLLLVDLHQQFDMMLLGESGFQMSVLDALAGHADLLREYRQAFRQLLELQKELASLKIKQAQADKESDYQKFLYTELQEAGLQENEFEKAESTLKLLSHSEAIKGVLTSIYHGMQLSEQPVVQQVRVIRQQLEPYSAYHARFPELLKRLSSVHIELQDIAEEIGSVNDRLQYDPGQIEKLNERINTGYKLFKKHNVHSTTELMQLQQELENKLLDVSNMTDAIHALEKQVETQVKIATEHAHRLSQGRKAQVAGLEEKVNALLKKVGMPNARIQVKLSATLLNPFGEDEVEFLFDANKSNRFESLKKVASGGELSRLMLCIKSLVAQSMDMPTLLFDEIDSGISGEAARQVGLILRDLSRKRQVICITHQPQIAGKGDVHFYVYKEILKGKMHT
ncbi:MAG: DNA repair protein RecN, partial [Bacteroidota bacterium]|nr:DNA repair protein RecN [Bacteroidota bacterium]